MDEIVIELRDGYENLKAFYYRDGNGSIFTCRDTKTPIILAMLFVLASSVFYFLAYLSAGVPWIFLSIIFTLASFIVIKNALRLCNQYLSWKNSVKSVLNEVKKHKAQQLIVNRQVIQLSNPDETKVDMWESFQHATFKTDAIYLRGNQNISYVFPAKSMNPGEFEALTAFIREIISARPPEGKMISVG